MSPYAFVILLATLSLTPVFGAQDLGPGVEVFGRPGAHTKWPLKTIRRGVIRCLSRGSHRVVFEAPDGTLYAVNDEAEQYGIWSPLSSLMDRRRPPTDSEAVVDAWIAVGKALCDRNIARAERRAQKANTLAAERVGRSQPSTTVEKRLYELLGNRLKEVKIHELSSGLVVVVSFIASDNLTFGMVRLGIERDMMECFHIMFGLGHGPIIRAVATAYYVRLDRFGYETESRVYEASMKRGLARKINWRNRLRIDLHNLGIVDYMDPVLAGM